VEVTVPSRGRPSRGGGGAERRRVVPAIGAVGVLAAVVAIWLSGVNASPGDPVSARGPDGVAAAYGYPVGCLSVTILATYARADLSHTAGCGHITGYAPAIFHYVAGRWRLVPDAIGYMCNTDALPAAVERRFGLCVGNIGKGCARLGTPGQGRPAAPLGWPCARLPKISGVV
jgi:hypothetical protein